MEPLPDQESTTGAPTNSAEEAAKPIAKTWRGLRPQPKGPRNFAADASDRTRHVLIRTDTLLQQLVPPNSTEDAPPPDRSFVVRVIKDRG